MGFPVDTEDGKVIVEKLPGNVLVAEDGTKLKPSADALKMEVIEAVGAVIEAVDEVSDVIDAAKDLADDILGNDEEDGQIEAEAEVEEMLDAKDEAEAEAPEAA